MRLHNRQLKASFFNDPDLLQWPRDKRYFYAGLIQIADDSACLEDSSFSFKLLIFPSPQDADLTIEQLTVWKDELITEKKLVSYISEGKKCLYISNFHKHQKLKSPSPPTVPLPEWVVWIPTKSNPNAGKYCIDKDMFNSILHSPYQVLTDIPKSSCNVLTNDLEKSYECLRKVFQPKPEPEPEPKEYMDDDDDNARAREEIGNRAIEVNQEESDDQALAIGTESVGNDARLASDTFCMSIAFDANQKDLKLPEDPPHALDALGSRAIAFAQANFGRSLVPQEIHDISDFCQKFVNKDSPDPDGIVIEGLKRCIDQDRRKMSYLKVILTRWLDHGVVEFSHISHQDAEWAANERKTAHKSKGGKDHAKDIRTSRSRINDSAAYDPSAWAKAGFAVST